jgi:short-subunit dehydrogenase
MVARRKGGIINLASSAGFQPLAGANIYAASKSFVILFSEALAQELDKQRVHVLAVCPGPVATAFFADNKPTIGRNQMDDPKSIVREVLRAFDAGKGIVIPGKFSIRLNAFAVRLLPRTLIARIAEGTTRKLNHQ